MSDQSQRPRRSASALFAISFIGLYLELVAIRWIPTQVRLLAYFSNFVLIACLLGLGLGMVLDRRPQRLLRLFPIGLAALVGTVLVLYATDFRLPFIAGTEWLWNTSSQATSTILAYVVLVAFVMLCALAFVPLGQEIGVRLRDFAPIRGYSINVAGSLAGVGAFVLVSYLGLDPVWWFGVGLVLLLGYQALVGDRARALAVPVVLFIGVLVTLVLVERHEGRDYQTRWSPYYLIQVSPYGSLGYDIKVNRDSHQQALDLSGRYNDVPIARSRKTLYDLPYRFVDAQRVLVIGAGTGNDVAAALRSAPNAQIDAVEIDPEIADLGKKLHPEHPYDNPRVHLHIADARAFLTRTHAHYDAIIFGFLDSHRLFSHMSSVRLDNYIYTTQSIANVRDRLTPNGVVALTFTVHEKWIADRLFGLLDHAFGHPPLVYEGDLNTIGTMFIDTPSATPEPVSAVATIGADEFNRLVVNHGDRLTWSYRPELAGFLAPGTLTADSRLPTDEWPYLYTQTATIAPNYLEVIFLTLFAAIALVWFTAPRVDVRRASTWNFFALGAAFALLETRGVTELGLVLGSTWVTNAVVISSILVMILVANLIVTRLPRLPTRAVYIALFGVLAFNFAVSLRSTLGLGYGFSVFLSAVQVGLPMLLSGIVFARSFQRADDPGAALGANLMGAVLGALLEYSSLIFGLRLLYVDALVFYLISFFIITGPGLRARNVGVVEVAARV